MSFVADKLDDFYHNGKASKLPFLNLISLPRCLMIMYRQDNFLLHWPSRDDVFNSMDAGIPVKNGVERNEENLNSRMIAPLTF